MIAWCPKCGRALSNVMNNGKGSCPTHGYQWGEPYAPILVVKEGEVVGIYMHKAEDAGVVYRDPSGDIRQALADRVSVVRYDDWEGEW